MTIKDKLIIKHDKTTNQLIRTINNRKKDNKKRRQK